MQEPILVDRVKRRANSKLGRPRTSAQEIERRKRATGWRRCTRCKKRRPLTAYYIVHRKNHQRHTVCPRCLAQLGNQWRRKNPYLAHVYQVQYRYGLPRAEYERLHRAQKSRCAICGAKATKRKVLCVDHCHRTNKIRGLLCKACNTGLGFFKDRVGNLQRAVQYLEQHELEPTCAARQSS